VRMDRRKMFVRSVSARLNHILLRVAGDLGGNRKRESATG
jgi:hypothetical protein